MENNQTSEKLGAFAYVIAGLAYIPLFGLFFGAIAITWGLLTKKIGGKKLALIGLGGVLLTIVLYGSLFYFGFVQRDGVYDNLRVQLAQTTINQVVPAIEFYKLQNGHYPKTLEILNKTLPKNSMLFLADPTDIGLKTPRYFYYQLIDQNHYYLLGLGKDNKPFTPDDILPTVDAKGTGLVIKKID